MEATRLAKLVVAATGIDKGRLEPALLEHERWGGDFARMLIDKRLVDEPVLVGIISREYSMASVDLDQYEIPEEVADVVPGSLVDEHRIIPLRIEGSFLDVAMVDPSNADALDAVRVHTRRNLRAYVTGPKMLERAMSRYYGLVSIGGYEVDPRVTSGTFLRADVIEIDSADSGVPISEVADRVAGEDRLALLEGQQTRDSQRIARLEALLARDEDVLRRLFGFLVDKGFASREEIVTLLK